jgi:5-methyltetrahydrofolate--homocysteine methyltransferase
METIVTSKTRQIIISPEQPTVLIGERINPTGKKRLAAALCAGDMELVRNEAKAQVEAGADILDINVGVAGINEIDLLPRALQEVMDTVDVPLSIDSSKPEALKAALKVYQGKPVINSVTGEERSLDEVLPLVKEYGTAVIGLPMDEKGIPAQPGRRLEIAQKIVERAEAMGIPREDVIIDCLVTAIGADSKAGAASLETIYRIKAELKVNMTLGASNISFGSPDRSLLTGTFLSIAVAMGVTCPIVDVLKVRSSILAADLVLGRDDYCMRYIKAFRQRQKQISS